MANKRNRPNKAKTERSAEAKSAERNSSRDSTTSDAGMYGAYTQMLKDAANLSYAWPTGSKVDLIGVSNTWNSYTPGEIHSIPGVCTLRILPTVGVSKDANSPVNVAARNIYSYVRHANSGHSNYDSPDLMLYLLAMDSVYSYLAFLKRLYGVMRVYALRNRYYPKVIINSMGVTFADIEQNLANLRYYINQYAVKCSALAIPSSMSYFVRHSWLYSNIYTDGLVDKAQIYLFIPDGFYQYLETQGKGQLTYLPFNNYYDGNVHDFESLITFGNSLLDPVLSSEDINIMSGDILKAFGAENLFRVSSVEEDYIVEPSYNPSVLSQIQNATVLDMVPDEHGYDRSKLNLTQDAEGSILWNPPVLASSPGLDLKRLMNLYESEPTPEMTMEASRLTLSTNVSPTITDDGGWSYSTLNSCGADIVVGFEVRKFVWDGNGKLRTPARRWRGFMGVDDAYALVADLADLEKFSYHPAITFVDVYSDQTPEFRYINTFMDVENYNVVNYQDIEKMHTTALLSMFHCPAMGAFSG